MDRNRCPACGSSDYNGRRCSHCLFEPFTEEIAHGMHTHEGEPLVLKTPPRRIRRQKGCRSFPGKRKRTSVIWVIAIIWIVISILIPLIVSSSFLFSDFGFAMEEPAPEPEPFADGTVLYYDGEITVTADWRDGDSFSDRLWIQVSNNSRRDVSVSAQRICVNGYMSDETFFYCDALKNRTTAELLWMDPGEFAELGIETVSDLSFQLHIYDGETFDLLAVSDQITLHASTPENFFQPVEDSGNEIYSDSKLRILFQGISGSGSDAQLQFYIENKFDKCLSVYSEEVRVNSENRDLFLWCEILPGARCICHMDLYTADSRESGSFENIDTLELRLGYGDSDDWNDYSSTDWISIDIP